MNAQAQIDVRRCAQCGAEGGDGLLACPSCGGLAHAAELTRLAGLAREAEASGDLTGALAAWRAAAVRLPPGTTQLATVVARIAELSAAIDGRNAKPREPRWDRLRLKGAGMGAVGALLFKAKSLVILLAGHAKLLLLGLTKLPTLVSMVVYMGWRSGNGVGYGIGVVACMYVHEIGHVAALKRYGIDATAPMFVPGLGAFVRLNQYPVDAHEDARTGLAGPLWGLAATCVAAAIGAALGSRVAWSIACTSALINLFNLIPVWQLDGSRGLRALSRGERLVVAGVAAAAAAIGTHPWLAVAVAGIVAVRAFTGDAHPTGDRRMLALYASLVAALAGVAAIAQGMIAAT
jgi:Zn-dependent protease